MAIFIIVSFTTLFGVKERLNFLMLSSVSLLWSVRRVWLGSVL